VTVHRVTFLIIKPTRCTNFSNLLLEWNSTCFRQFLCPSSRVFHCTHSNGICHTCLRTACEQDQDGTSWSCLQGVSKPVWHIPLSCVQWKTPDDGQRNCPKLVEYHSKNKFEKLVHLVGFVIRNLTYYLLGRIHFAEYVTPSPRECSWYLKIADSLQAGSGWSILILLASCPQTCMTYIIAVSTVKNSWWWTEEFSEICRVSFQE